METHLTPWGQQMKEWLKNAAPVLLKTVRMLLLFRFSAGIKRKSKKRECFWSDKLIYLYLFKLQNMPTGFMF